MSTFFSFFETTAYFVFVAQISLISQGIVMYSAIGSHLPAKLQRAPLPWSLEHDTARPRLLLWTLTGKLATL